MYSFFPFVLVCNSDHLNNAQPFISFIIIGWELTVPCRVPFSLLHLQNHKHKLLLLLLLFVHKTANPYATTFS